MTKINKNHGVIEHSLLMFRESLGSSKTQFKYEYLVRLFREYFDLKDFDSIIEIDKKEIQRMVETYTIHVKKTVNPNTVPTYLNPVKTFLETNDIDLNWRKIKRLFPTKIKRSGSSAYQTEDVRMMLESTPQLRNKALIHFVASTGCRVGAIEDLTLNNLRDMPLGCKSVLFYEDSTEEYYSFLTPEASSSLERYFAERTSQGERLTQNSPVFRQSNPNNHDRIETPAIQGILTRSLKKSGVRGQKKNGRFSEQLAHGFRKRFNTILKMNNSVNDNAIEKMMGHTNGLDGTYLQITLEKLFDEFAKGISDLTIDQTERQRAEIEQLKEEKSTNQQLTKRLEIIENMLLENKQYSLKQHEIFHPEVKEEIEKLVNQLQTNEK